MNRNNVVSTKPNRLLPGYFHVSKLGPAHCTYRRPDTAADSLKLLSKRQRRKAIKQLRRREEPVNP